jgi:hypothetical protein
MKDIIKAQDELCQRFTSEQVQEFNNWQLTQHIKEHPEEFDKLMKRLRDEETR